MQQYCLSGTSLKGPEGYRGHQAIYEQKCPAKMNKIKCILGYTSRSETSTQCVNLHNIDKAATGVPCPVLGSTAQNWCQEIDNGPLESKEAVQEPRTFALQ